MQISTLTFLRDRSTASASQTRPGGTVSFFEAHPVAEIIRGLFLSSVLWVLLALAVYMVYAMVLGSN
jgi:hypothetical protein